MDGKNAAEHLESQDRHPAILPKFSQPLVLKRPLEEPEDEQKVKRHRQTMRRHPTYRRHGKPPYTYVGMMVVAIHTSSTKRLTLVGIRESLAAMFPFFQGEYLGWRDSVRHNLSSNRCFTRIQRGVNKNIKGCFWEVDLSLVPPTAFLRASTKDPALRKKWAPTLTEQLGIPDINLPAVQTNIKSEKSGDIQQVTSEKVDKEFVASKTTFSIDHILGKNTKPDLICEPPDKKFDHPYSFFGHQTSMTYMQGKFPRPALTFSPYEAMLYRTVEQGSDRDPFLRPDPRYSESHPFSEASAFDLRKCPAQVEDQESSIYPGNRRYTVAERAPAESTMYVDHIQTSENDLDQFQMEALHHQTSYMKYKQPTTSYPEASSMSYLPPSSASYLPSPSTSYLPSPSTSYLPSPRTSYRNLPSTDYNQGPTSFSYDSHHATSYDAGHPSMSYNPPSRSDHQVSSSTSCHDESSSMTYHHWSTDYPDQPFAVQSNSDCSITPRSTHISSHNNASDLYPMGPPRSSTLTPVPTFSWATYLNNSNINFTPSAQSLKTAFNDLPMFSDESSEVSVRPNIPLYAFVDDSQSLPESVVPESVTTEQGDTAFGPCNPDVINNFAHPHFHA